MMPPQVPIIFVTHSMGGLVFKKVSFRLFEAKAAPDFLLTS